jgi:RNA polymerase sigma-70 factor, ECF subfamily
MTHGEREEYALSIHTRLLRLDPVAPAEFIEAFLSELVLRLRAKAGPNSEDTFIRDAATDAILYYVQHPSKFNPAKSALLTYLTMAAYGDFLNMIAKEKRRLKHEIRLEPVEDSLDDGNNIIEPENEELDITTTEKVELLRIVNEAFPDARDRAILDLMMNGERKTMAYCEILGLNDLSPDQQRKIVKQHKDRITKSLQRLGGKIHGKQE